MAVDAGILDNITLEFLGVFKGDAVLIQHAAKTLFFYLVVIQLALSAIWMSIAGESLQRFVSRMIQLCFSFGFFYALIQFGGQWIPELINGFIEVGKQGGVGSLDPSSVLSQGVSISGAIFHGFYNWGLLTHPFVSLVGSAICVGIIILYALITAELTVILVKSYAIISIGSLFFAFGASDYTNQMAKNYFKTAIGLGLQLMTMYLILGVGQHIGAQWSSLTAKAVQQHELTPMYVICGAVIVYYLVIKNVPAFIAGIAGVSGFRNYGDAAVGMAVNAGMTAANTLSNAKHIGGKTTQGLTEISKASAHGVSNLRSGSFSMQSAASAAATNVGKAGFHSFKDMAMRSNQHMSFGQKMNHHLANTIKPSANKPSPGGTS